MAPHAPYRLALFDSAHNSQPNKPKFGRGLLDVPRMFDGNLAAELITRANAGTLAPSAEYSVSFPPFRLLFGLGPPRSGEEQMYETEVSQVISRSSNHALRKAAREGRVATRISSAERRSYRAMLINEVISRALRKRIGTPRLRNRQSLYGSAPLHTAA